MTDTFDLTGRVAVVTGASRGIGEAIASAFAERGAKVVVSSRKADACAEVAQRISDAGGEARAIACHIGDMQALGDLFATIERDYGRLDVLVNNAATNPYYGHVLDTDLAAFQKTVDVNIRGYFFASVLGGRLMRGEAQWLDHQRCIGQCHPARPPAGHLLDHEGCGAQSHKGICARVRAGRDTRERDSAGPDPHEVRRRAAVGRRTGRALSRANAASAGG